MTNLCPVCGKGVPDNEWAAYRMHEDCFTKDLLGGVSDLSEPHLHQLGGKTSNPPDRHRGRPGQDQKRSTTDGG
jgi:hypothetical protein